jgi:hypothetical protein
MTDLCGCRVATLFDGKIVLVSVREKIRGAVLAPTSSGITEFQAVWKIEYDDGDTEQLNRKEIVATVRLYQLHQKVDNQIPPAIVDSGNTIEVGNDNLDDEADILGMLSIGTTFLDPRYKLL